MILLLLVVQRLSDWLKMLEDFFEEIVLKIQNKFFLDLLKEFQLRLKRLVSYNNAFLSLPTFFIQIMVGITALALVLTKDFRIRYFFHKTSSMWRFLAADDFVSPFPI